jgi:hypothetical protein
MGVVYAEMMRESKNIFEGLNDVIYWPYIGHGYFKCREKILVLGESHYLADPKRREEKENDHYWTNDVLVGSYLDQNYTQCFSSFAEFPKWIPLPKDSYLKGFRNTAKMLAHSGTQCSDYVWKNLAFFNFFQKPVATRPGSHEWLNADYDNYIDMSRLAFGKVMEMLTPDIVIVWGKGNLDKKWLPANKKSLYPDVVFFPINHPSYNIRRTYIEKWNDFVKKGYISEKYAAHHPFYLKIEKLFRDVNQKLGRLKSIPKWYSERSIGFKLDLNTNVPNAMVMLATMDELGKMSITLSTRRESVEETKKIVNHPFFDIFNHNHCLNEDGVFELCSFDSNACDEDLVSVILRVLQAMNDYRNSLI